MSSVNATVCFGLVSIPVKLQLAASSENFSFNMITPAGNRVTQKMLDVSTGAEVKREECDAGYEYAKGDYVVFKKEDLKALHAEMDQTIDLAEFAPVKHFDPKHVEKSYYLHPGKGSERSFRLLARALHEEGRMAIGKYYARGRDNLVAIVAGDNDSLTLFQLFYVNEVRKIEYSFTTQTEPAARELKMAKDLIRKDATNDLDLSAYVDEYTERVRNFIEKKREAVARGEALSPAAVAAIGAGKVVDLEELLAASLDKPKKAKKSSLKEKVTEVVAAAKGRPAKGKRDEVRG